MSAVSGHPPHESRSPVYAAIARTASRATALYFARPIRLFRPSKVSGWHSLGGLATQHGSSVTPRFLSDLVKKQGIMVIPRHFIPPMIVNAALGTVLWVSYAELSELLESRIGNASVPVSGALAGAAQAVFAAPAENVRLVLEGGGKEGWSQAWKEVFLGTEPSPAAGTAHSAMRKEQRWREMRQMRAWVREWGLMAGRGWGGWVWGCAKDMCGFAAFFSVFEVTRHVARKARTSSKAVVSRKLSVDSLVPLERHVPRVVHGLVLVAGGVFAGLTYELVCQPWDVARRIVRVDRLLDPQPHSASRAILRKFQEGGLRYFFRDSTRVAATGASPRHGRWYAALRTLGRVGPWGVGFLVWEAFGPGLS